MNKAALLNWFRDLFLSRTPPRVVEDALVSQRIGWSEIWAEMQDQGFQGDVVAGRLEWNRIAKKNRLKQWCIRKDKELDTGEPDV